MKRHVIFLAVLGLAAFMLGPVGTAQAATPAEGASVVALVGNVQGHTSSFEPATPDLTGRSTFGGRCSVPSNWVIGFAGTGTLRGFGNLTFTGTHCTQFDQASGKGTYTDGRFTYLLSSGARFTGTHVGVFQIIDNVSYIKGVFVLSGGTGPFAHRAGGWLENGSQDLGTDLLQMDMTGIMTTHGNR